jgi:hypothetical protein
VENAFADASAASGIGLMFCFNERQNRYNEIECLKICAGDGLLQ